MTIWAPNLPADAPKARALCEAIARDVAGGVLAPGAQLPPQRDLARILNVTVGTVGRAYAQARRRGLVTGEVGRGTFVRRRDREDPSFTLLSAESAIDLSINSPDLERPVEPLHSTLIDLLEEGRLRSALAYQPPEGTLEDREAGCRWLAHFGMDTGPERIVVTCGGQHAMVVALSAGGRAEDLILSEQLAYSGIRAAAHFLGLRLDGVALDELGVDPEAFEEACKRATPRALYCTPSFQNPTGSLMPDARRKEIATIANRHGVTIIEDDLYGFLARRPPAPLVQHAESGFYLSSLSKGLAPGLRLGYLVADESFVPRLIAGVMGTTLMVPPLLASAATRLLENGTMDHLLRAHRDQMRERGERARAFLGDHLDPGCDQDSPHQWLRLPAPWRADELVAQARDQGVAVAAAERFVVGRATAPHAIRMSLGGVRRDEDLDRGLAVVARLLERPPTPVFAGP